MAYRVGVIGTGAQPGDPDSDGYSMGYRHGEGYERLDRCELVACTDIVPEHAAAFADRFDIDDGRIFEDHREMLETCDLDIVSIATPPATHADITIDAARTESVRAVHCEKPMADTWADSKRMARVAQEEGVQLTFNHQMRFGKPFSTVKELIDDGTVGDLRRFEFGDSTLFDNGTHLFDLCNFYNDGADVEWVLAQVEYSEENRMFGTHNENQAIAQWRYENGVYGLASTGWGEDFLDGYFRAIGTNGTITIQSGDGTVVVDDDSGRRRIDTRPDAIYNPNPGTFRAGLNLVSRKLPGITERYETPRYTHRAVEQVIDALETGSSTGLEASFALPATETIFAAWESSRRRGRVELPLENDGNALTEMVESGALEPEPRD